MPPNKPLDRLQYNLGLDNQTIIFAEGLHTAVSAAGICNGRSIAEVATACAYLAVRELEKPVSLSDLEDGSGLDKGDINAAYQEIIGEFSIQLQPEQPDKYLTEFVRRLDDEHDAHLGTPVVEQAKDIVENSRGYTSSTAVGIAAGAIYVGADLEGKRLTLDEVADVANVSADTVQKNAHVHKAVIEGL